MLRPSLGIVLMVALAGCAEAADAWAQASEGAGETHKDPQRSGEDQGTTHEGPTPGAPGAGPDARADTDAPAPDASAGTDAPAPDVPADEGGEPDAAELDPPAQGPEHAWEGMRVGTNFWFLASWGENAWKEGVDFANTSDPWNPAFVGDLSEADYALYRFMDFGGTNNSAIRAWSERTQKASPENQGGGDVGGRGIAYEWMFDLCNRMQKDCWINVPHLAIESYEQNPDDNFFAELAKLAKAELDPNLALYLEYSNETWNGGFGQARYAQERGMQMGYAADGYSAGFKFHVYASSRMYDAFVKVFGQEIGRVKWVVAGQLGSAWGTQMQLEALKDPQINLGQRTPAFYAISNYVGSDNSIDGADPNLAQRYREGIAEMARMAGEQKQMIDGLGMRFISDEGGQHILNNADAFARDPLAYDLYTEWLDASAELFVLTTNYAHSGEWGAGGAWGVKARAGQSLSEAPKARAIVDWIKAHP